MENPSWLFVLAAAIAVIGIVIAFKQLAASLEEKIFNKERSGQEPFQKDLSSFFIKVAIIEAIPIILIVLGFINIETLPDGRDPSDLTIPLFLVIFSFIFGVLNIFLTRGRLLADQNIEGESKAFINTVIFVGIGMVSAIPIIAAIAILTMMGIF